jgi:hypothetical protein
MKYIIQLPINIKCDINCGKGCYYCFYSELRNSPDRLHERAFTLAQFMAWRNKHLADATEILYELHGGEPHCNAAEVLEIIDTVDGGKFQLQTNGLGTREFYAELVKRKDKIDRIGFTFHRAVIGNDAAATTLFAGNVSYARGAGLRVYVKELLIPEYKGAILKDKKAWEKNGVEFRIQDFRGVKGLSPVPLSIEDYNLLHPEYQHNGYICECRAGYKNIIIRGYDIFAGDVLACWHDPCVIGNINDDWYNPNYIVARSPDAPHGVDVQCTAKFYRGTYPRDLWSPENEKKYKQLNKNQLKQRSSTMKSEKEVVARIERLEQAKAVKQQEVAAIESEFKRLQDAHAQALEWIKGAEYSIAELRETLNPQVDKEAAPEEVEAVDADPIAAPPELFDKPKRAAHKGAAAKKG